jgi:hypothetical protein
MGAADPREERERLALSQAVAYLIDESRMVLPGIQALFGFQLIAVFSDRFQSLNPFEQQLHFLSIALVVIATGLIMTPAAYHRHQEAREVTHSFIVGSTRLLLIGMAPLAFALALDVYLIGQLILSPSQARSWALAVLCLLVFLWFVFPRMKSLQRLLSWTP